MIELDFIINYDIKYRMGDELNAGVRKMPFDAGLLGKTGFAK